VPLPDPPEESEMSRWLLMRRGIEDPAEYAYYLVYGPKETTVEELIRVAGKRWIIEDCFQAAKGEVGLDEYEVRKWDGWHRHTTLRACWRTLTSHAYLAVVRSVAEHEQGVGKRGISNRSSTPS
jgi:SRSO17 transposase